MELNIKSYAEKVLIMIGAIGLLSACGYEQKKKEKLNLHIQYEQIEKTGLVSDLILDLLHRDTVGIPEKLKNRIRFNVRIYKPNKPVDQKLLKEISRISRGSNSESHFRLRNFIDSLPCNMVFNLMLDKELRVTNNSANSIDFVYEDIYILGHIVDNNELFVYSINSVDIDWGVGYIQLYEYIGRDSIRRKFERRLWIK